MDTREREQTASSGEVDAAPPQEDTLIEEGSAKRPGRPIVWIIAAAAVVLLLLFWGVPYLKYARSHQSTDDARVDASVVAVTSKINERITSILVDTDQRVRKGELVVALDNVTERAAVDQARANLQFALENQSAGVTQGSGGIAQAQAQVQNAGAQVPEAQAGVAAAQAQVAQARAALPGARQAVANAQANLARSQSLVRTGDVARSQLDAAQAQYEQAVSQYNAAQQAVTVAQANVDSAAQHIGAAQAGVAAAQGGVTTAQGKLSQAQAPAQIASQRAALAIAEQNLRYTKIYSPIDGFVGEKSVELGQVVQPGNTLMTLVPNRVFITANFKETQVGSMRPGQPVDIKVDAYKGMTFHGKVDSVNPASQNTYALVPAQNATGNFVKVTQRIPVKIVFTGTDFNKYPMRPGMSVETSVLVK
ncbi:MAG: HlyD family secretion protein [Candidatus Baltobacteraceae bacterium]